MKPIDQEMEQCVFRNVRHGTYMVHSDVWSMIARNIWDVVGDETIRLPQKPRK